MKLQFSATLRNSKDTQVLDSKISSKTNNRYVITNVGWSGEIPPGGSVTIRGAGTGNPAELLNAVISEN